MMFDLTTSTYHQNMYKKFTENKLRKWRKRGVITEELYRRLLGMILGDKEMRELGRFVIDSKRKEKSLKREMINNRDPVKEIIFLMGSADLFNEEGKKRIVAMLMSKDSEMVELGCSLITGKLKEKYDRISRIQGNSEQN